MKEKEIDEGREEKEGMSKSAKEELREPLEQSRGKWKEGDL